MDIRQPLLTSGGNGGTGGVGGFVANCACRTEADLDLI